MQRQPYMTNLFVESGFQLFNMKTLFYFKLRTSACMIDTLKTRNIPLILTPFRSTEVFKNVGIFVRKEMLLNTRDKMPIGFTNITSYRLFCKPLLYIHNGWWWCLKHRNMFWKLKSVVVFLKISCFKICIVTQVKNQQ